MEALYKYGYDMAFSCKAWLNEIPPQYIENNE